MLVMKTWPTSPLSEFDKVNTELFFKKGKLQSYMHSYVMHYMQVIMVIIF